MSLRARQDARYCHQLVTNKDGTRKVYSVAEFADSFDGQGVLVYEKSVEAAARNAAQDTTKLTPAELKKRQDYYNRGDALATASPADNYCLLKLLPNGTVEITNGMTGRPVDDAFNDLSDAQISEQRRELTPTEIAINRGELSPTDPKVLDTLRAELKKQTGVEQPARTPAVERELSR